MNALHGLHSDDGYDRQTDYGHPTRFTHEPLDGWTDGLEPRAAINRIMLTLAVVLIVAAIFFVAHIITTTPA